MNIFTTVSQNITYIEGFFVILTAIISFVNNFRKANAGDVQTLQKIVKDQQTKLITQDQTINNLHKNDMDLQRLLNEKEILIQQIIEEMRTEQTNIQTNEVQIERQFPEQSEVLHLLLNGVNNIFEKVNAIEAVVKPTA